MRYSENREQSAEILRQVIAAMAQHRAAYHPLTYAVFYELIAGHNPSLAAAIASATADGAALSDDDIARLFDTHILAERERTVQQTCDAVQSLMRDVGQSTQAADDCAGQYVESLARIHHQLTDDTSTPGLSQTVRALIDGTVGMRQSVAGLRRQLNESTRRIEELQEALSEARNQAMIDPLTGLVNRRGFDSALQTLLDGSDDASAMQTCMLMIDIDHFKRINDTYGHLTGDKVIRSVAQVLKDSVKGKDTVARLGGEEFSVLLPETPIAGARALAEQLRAKVERGRIRRTDTQATIATVTVSIGVSAYRPDDSTEAFVRRADEALYAAKHAGRNRVAVDSASLRAA